MERWSPSLIIREMQIKTTMRYLLILVRMAIIRRSTNSKWRECGEKGILLYCWRWVEKILLQLVSKSVLPVFFSNNFIHVVLHLGL